MVWFLVPDHVKMIASLSIYCTACIEIWNYGTIRWPHTYHSLTPEHNDITRTNDSCTSSMNGLFFWHNDNKSGEADMAATKIISSSTHKTPVVPGILNVNSKHRSTFNNDVKCGDKYCIVEYSLTKCNKYVIKKIHRAKIESTVQEVLLWNVNITITLWVEYKQQQITMK